jgi:hypothetical protein
VSPCFASVIEVLAEDIDRLGQTVERIAAPSPYRKRRSGYIIDDGRAKEPMPHLS